MFHEFIDTLNEYNVPFTIRLFRDGSGNCLVEYPEGITWFSPAGDEVQTWTK